jgi:hypothetical protein
MIKITGDGDLPPVSAHDKIAAFPEVAAMISRFAGDELAADLHLVRQAEDEETESTLRRTDGSVTFAKESVDPIIVAGLLDGREAHSKLELPNDVSLRCSFAPIVRKKDGARGSSLSIRAIRRIEKTPAFD